MESGVHSVRIDMTLRDAIALLTTKRIGGAPVIDTTQVVVSTLSEGDALRLAASFGLDVVIGSCLEHLTPSEKVITARRTATFADLYKIFITQKIHRIIITDDRLKLLGIVTRSSILKILLSGNQIHQAA